MVATARDRWYVLAVLTLVYALNIADRFSVSTLLEPIRVELHLSDSGVAFLTGVAMALFYVTVGVPVASLADRSNRRNIVAGALAAWSVMTAASGLAQNYTQLLLARFGVGIGEAGGTPPSTAILADIFPGRLRPMALTIFALGASIGAWVGASITGSIAQRYGWRAAFLALGLPGLAFAILVRLTVREPERGALDAMRLPHRPSSVWATVRFLWSQRSAFHLIAGCSVATFWSWGLIWWTPTFLQRSHHMSVGEAGALLGPMHLLAGSAGTLLAGWAMSRSWARDARSVTRILAAVIAVSTLPSILIYLVASKSAVTVLLWIFMPAVYFYIGPILGLLQNVVPPQMRATSCAIGLFTANLGNLVAAPQLIGWLSDEFAAAFGAGTESLRWALLFLAPTGLWAAWHLWRCGATIRDDEARAAYA